MSMVLDWFTKNELRHLFIHGTKRTLECNKCSVKQHFCHVLRFARTLRFTPWFVHKTFEVVRSVPVISFSKICKKKKILRMQIKASSRHRDSTIRIWLLKNRFKIPSTNVICEAKAALHHCLWDWKWNNRFHCSWEAKNLASAPTVHIYCSCNRIETFSFQLSSMTTKCVNVCSRTLANGQIKRRIYRFDVHNI